MPDVRDIVARLNPEDLAVWNEHRTCMRRCYLAAVNATIKIEAFKQEDDSFLDLIDIRLALLFDRAGWLPSGLENITGKETADKIEEELKTAEDELKNGNSAAPVVSDAVKALGEWGTGK